MTRRSSLLLFTLGILLGGGALFGHRVVTRHTLAARYIPAVPALNDRPAVLAESLAEAETRSRNWLKSTRGLAELSRLYHANGFYPEAMTCYDGLRLLEPANARWPHLQASIITNFGRMDEALPLRQQAVELAPDYIPARLRLGDVLLKANRPADAAKVYAEVLRRAPGDPYALLGLARCDLVANDWLKAKERLQEAMAKNPDNIGVLSLLVTVSEHLGDTGAAESLKAAIGRREFSDLPDPWVDELAEVCFDPYRLSVSAAVANAAGNRSTALDLLDRAIALAPNASSYQRQAGQLLLDDHNYGAARNHLEKAVALNPADSDAWLRLIDALRGLGQDQAAVSAMLNGLSHCPESPSLHLEYARWLRSANRIEEAIAEFRYAYQLRPSEASPLVELATAYLTAGRTNEAVASLNLALERQPDHPTALATLAFIAVSSNDEAGALRRWEQLRRQPKTPAAIMSQLRQAYQQQFGHSLP